METIWLCLISSMIGMYVVLDGFDLGAGIIHLLVGRNAEERRLVLRSIAPVWDGNEVWLLAAGGTLYFAFPAVYASGFSGFYLPLMILLWLLILRAISIEFRNHIRGPIWIHFWDVTFCVSSVLIAVFLGAALGNVIRGVPLDEKGYFFEPLWTDFRLGADTGILDWYTVLVGLAALVTLALHGALWVTLKTEGPVSERCRHIARELWWAVAAFWAIVTVATFAAQPQVLRNLSGSPWGIVFPALSLVGLLFIHRASSLGQDRGAFLASSAYILGMLTSAVFGIYPYLLPARTSLETLSLSVHNSKAGEYGLKIGLVWWTVGMVLASGYFIFVYRHFRGKVKLDGEQEGY